MDIWTPITAAGTVAAAGIAAWAAWQAKDAATKLTRIESERHQTELCPRLRVSCAPLNPGNLDRPASARGADRPARPRSPRPPQRHDPKRSLPQR